MSRRLVLDPRSRGDAEEEIRSHLEMREESYRAAGVSPEEARRRAREEFGDVAEIVRECRRLDRRLERRGRRADMLEELWIDLRGGLRSLRARPGFALLTAATLALGVGATTALFSVLHGVLLRPLPYAESERLVALTSANAGRGWSGMPLPPGAYFEIEQRAERLQAVAAYQADKVTLLGEEPRRVSAAKVSGNFFSVLGVHAVIGRTLQASDDQPGGPQLCVISERRWRADHGGDPGAVGSVLALEGGSCEVVGVVASEVQWPERATEVWLPLALDRSDPSWGSWYLRGVARLADDAEIEAAQGELETLALAMAENLPFGGGWRFRLEPLSEELLGEVRTAVVVLFVAVCLVLLIACVNLASLLLARAFERGREMAVRAALGAGRLRLVRQVLTENLVLSLLGGGVAILLAWWGVELLKALGPADLPRLEQIRVDGWVLAFALLTSVVAAVLSGVLPAWQAGRQGPRGAALRVGPQSADPTRARLRSLLVVAEVALAVMLLIGSGLMLGSFDRLLRVDSGFDPEGVLAMRFDLPASRYDEEGQRIAFFERLRREIERLPPVESAALSSALPTRGALMIGRLEVEGGATGEEAPQAATEVVSAELFRLLQVPLVEGRLFAPGRLGSGSTEVVVNETAARTAFGGRSAVGQRVLDSDDETWHTVVGVVGDVRQFGLKNEPPLQLYLPHGNEAPRRMHLLARTSVDPELLAPEVRALVQRLDPALPIAELSTLSAVVSDTISGDRFNAALMTLFGALAVGVAAVGVYGVIAFTAGRRTREMGIRLALGADRRQVFRLVMRQGLALGALGLLAGVIGALLLGRYLESLLFEISATEPAVYAVMAAAVALLSLLASWAPARRVALVDPASTLRWE